MTQRQTLVRSDREERAASNEIRITITLIAVVIMFLVCQLPTAATLIYNIFHDPSPQSNEEAVLRALGNIFNCLVSVNAACNFLLYCALSDKYRRTFMRTFCRCVYRPGSPFFTQVDNDNGHHGNYTHSRQASVCINQRDRYLSTRPAQRPSATRNTLNGSYLAIPDGIIFGLELCVRLSGRFFLNFVGFFFFFLQKVTEQLPAREQPPLTLRNFAGNLLFSPAATGVHAVRVCSRTSAVAGLTAHQLLW